MIINFGVGDRLTCSSGSLGSGLISTGSATPTSEALLEVRRTGGAGGLSSSSEYILKRHSRVSPAKNITSIRYHKFKLNSLSPPPLHFALLSLALSYAQESRNRPQKKRTRKMLLSLPPATTKKMTMRRPPRVRLRSCFEAAFHLLQSLPLFLLRRELFLAGTYDDDPGSFSAASGRLRDASGRRVHGKAGHRLSRGRSSRSRGGRGRGWRRRTRSRR